MLRKTNRLFQGESSTATRLKPKELSLKIKIVIFQLLFKAAGNGLKAAMRGFS